MKARKSAKRKAYEKKICRLAAEDSARIESSIEKDVAERARRIVVHALERGYLTDKITVTIGDRSRREIRRTPKNIAMLEAIHHFDAAGRITAADVAAHASASRHQVEITKRMAADFLKLMFEPQSLEEVERMMADLTKGPEEAA